MKKEKILSFIVMLLICGGIGYGVYRNAGKVIHEVLLLEGETTRVGSLTNRKVTQQYHDHELSVPSGHGYSIFLEGHFPAPAKRIDAKNHYSLKITDQDGQLLFDDKVELRFKNKEKKEGLNQIVGDAMLGKIGKKVIDLVDLTKDAQLSIHFSRIDGDTVVNELYLTIREKRG